MAPRVRFNVNAGDAFGQLTVIREERLPLTPGRAAHGFTQGLRGARCRCTCGVETVVNLVNLRNGSTRSCGCLHAEKAMENLAKAVRVSASRRSANAKGQHPLRGTWHGMMARCYNANHMWHKRYGGRGITVCAPWHDAETFFADIARLLGERPEGMTLDRIDNDGHYEPGNVRWASRSAQTKNQSRPSRLNLTDEQIYEMRLQRRAGAVLRELAESFGVSIATAHRLTRDA